MAAKRSGGHSGRGTLIVVEGIDGSGKSTQVHLLQRWLESLGNTVHFTEWNSSEAVREIIRKGKKKNLLTPTTFSLLHATDFADRYERHIYPHLRAGHTVLCDRYIYTAMSRDTARGCSAAWVRNLYSFAQRPDLTFYFEVDPATALSRLRTARPNIKYYEAGMDLGLSVDREQSFLVFQQLVLDAYQRIGEQEGFVVLDGRGTIEQEQERMRGVVRGRLGIGNGAAGPGSQLASFKAPVPAPGRDRGRAGATARGGGGAR